MSPDGARNGGARCWDPGIGVRVRREGQGAGTFFGLGHFPGAPGGRGFDSHDFTARIALLCVIVSFETTTIRAVPKSTGRSIHRCVELEPRFQIPCRSHSQARYTRRDCAPRLTPSVYELLHIIVRAGRLFMSSPPRPNFLLLPSTCT